MQVGDVKGLNAAVLAGSAAFNQVRRLVAYAMFYLRTRIATHVSSIDMSLSCYINRACTLFSTAKVCGSPRVGWGGNNNTRSAVHAFFRWTLRRSALIRRLLFRATYSCLLGLINFPPKVKASVCMGR